MAQTDSDVAEVVDGELPSAGTVEAYEQVLPGAADRIIAMLEQQSIHRMEMERAQLEKAAKAERRQQLLGVSFVLVVFLVATALITGQHEGPGTLLAAADLLLLAAFFIRRDNGSTKIYASTALAQRR